MPRLNLHLLLLAKITSVLFLLLLLLLLFQILYQPDGIITNTFESLSSVALKICRCELAKDSLRLFAIDVSILVRKDTRSGELDV